MRFTHFRAWEVKVPARRDIIATSDHKGKGYVSGATWPDMPIFIVEGTLTNGLTAVGEASRGETGSSVKQTLNELLNTDLTSFHPRVKWSGSHEITGLPSPFTVPSWTLSSGRSYMLMETLWLDALGKSLGLPAYSLLGGAVRNTVPVDYWANKPDAGLLIKLIDEARSHGLNGIKLKCDSLGTTASAIVASARDIPTQFHITLDAMCSWRTFRESQRLFEALASLGSDIRIEDPFPHGAYKEWQRAADAFPSLTLVFHARDYSSFKAAISEGTFDALNLSGPSMFDFQHIASIAEFHGYDCWQGSGLELGVMQHWRLHGSACASAAVLPSDLQSEWVREHTLVVPKMTYRNGHAIVPTSPGLGVSLDHDAIPKYLISTFEVM